MSHSYSTVVSVVTDGDLQQRFIAAAATEGIPNPDSWVLSNRWALAAHDTGQGGMLDSYQYAIDTDPNHFKALGRDPGIVSDGVILSVVQAVHAALEATEATAE